MPYTVLDLITESLEEIGAYGQGEVPEAEDAAFALSKLQRMIDAWNAQEIKVYNTIFQQYVIVPGLQPATIGATGSGATYETPIGRPVRIVAGNVLLNNVVPYVKSPLNIRKEQFWENQPVPNVSSTLPTDLYYSPSWPLGQLYLWPVPQTAYGLELWFWQLLTSAVTMADVIDLPFGYRDALVYSLAIALAPSFGKDVSAALALLAKNAVNVIQGNNSGPPNIVTTDSGIPDRSRKQIPSFNWRTGQSGY